MLLSFLGQATRQFKLKDGIPRNIWSVVYAAVKLFDDLLADVKSKFFLNHSFFVTEFVIHFE